MDVDVEHPRAAAPRALGSRGGDPPGLGPGPGPADPPGESASDHCRRCRTSSYSPRDRVAITGSGASGLAAAYFLVRAGHRPDRISIYERCARPGGHARTVYLHRADGELRVVKDYQMAFEKSDIFLEFEGCGGSKERLRANDNPDVIPVDVGVCGFTVQFGNFDAMLRDMEENDGLSFSPQRHEYLKSVERAIHLSKKFVLRTDATLGGQLWKPWNWCRLLRLVLLDFPRIVPYCEEKGRAHLRTITVAALLEELRGIGIGQDGLDLFVAFCQVGSGYSDRLFAKISALYLYDFFTKANFHNRGERNTIWRCGVSAYVHRMVSLLEKKGVRFVKEPERTAKYRIYAVQPHDARRLNPALPKIECTTSHVYIHCHRHFQGPERATLTYGRVKDIASATWALDRMRPDLRECGAFVTFTTPDHVSEIEDILKTPKKALPLNSIEGNDHDLRDAPVKTVWLHAYADVPAEEKKRDIQENHQGRDGTYYCGSSYLDSMLHENAVTSALDVACAITGERSRLAALGFEPSDLRRESPKASKAGLRARPWPRILWIFLTWIVVTRFMHIVLIVVNTFRICM